MISPKGSPSERIWIIAEEPLSKDKDKGFLFSSTMGWSYDKMVGEAGISRYYATFPTGGEEAKLITDVNKYSPPIIIVLDNAGKTFIPQLQSPEAINHYAGSILTSPHLSYPHYIIPTHGPETCVRDWTERQIVKYIDYGKIRDEYAYWAQHGSLNPLPERQLVIDLSVNDLLAKFEKWLDPQIPYISVDIESIYPREKSEFFGHPGYAILVGIAVNPYYGISFNLWPEDKYQAKKLWFSLANLLSKKKIIGQNFDMFDSWHFDMLGMKINRREIYDTRLRHAVLWPELSHKLAFLTRQYTRQPYYKDENVGYKPKQDNSQWMKYNALDCCTTYEVFLGQEEEFKQRPHLK